MARETMNGVDFRKEVVNTVNLAVNEELKVNEKQVQAVKKYEIKE